MRVSSGDLCDRNHDKGSKTKMQKTDPMRVFVVHAHPDPRSFNRAMCRQTVATLTAAGHDVRVSDLYAQGFNPVGIVNENRVEAGRAVS